MDHIGMLMHGAASILNSYYTEQGGWTYIPDCDFTVDMNMAGLPNLSWSFPLSQSYIISMIVFRLPNDIGFLLFRMKHKIVQYIASLYPVSSMNFPSVFFVHFRYNDDGKDEIYILLYLLGVLLTTSVLWSIYVNYRVITLISLW